jgi:type IV secretory pathway VirD2 relaxase
MSDVRRVQGFEDAWRPPVRPHRVRPEDVLRATAGSGLRARLSRIVRRVPEVMVKVTGRTRHAGHLGAHLDYISRNGALELEDRDGAILAGRRDVRELAEDWSAAAGADSRRRTNTPFSVSVVLSMPEGTDPAALRDAAGAFAQATFADRFDYVFALHTDAGHPHVHLAVRALGDHGERLNPRKADLEAWRQAFAQALRDRGVEAEATPRRARGVTRKPERSPIRQLRARHTAGQGAMPRVRQAAYREAGAAAFGGDVAPRAWERALVARQAQIRGIYLAEAALLSRSPDPADRDLAQAVEAFVRAMPAPDSQRLALARELREADLRARDGPARPGPPGAGPDRGKSR